MILARSSLAISTAAVASSVSIRNPRSLIFWSRCHSASSELPSLQFQLGIFFAMARIETMSL